MGILEVRGGNCFLEEYEHCASHSCFCIFCAEEADIHLVNRCEVVQHVVESIIQVLAETRIEGTVLAPDPGGSYVPEDWLMRLMKQT